MSIEKKLFGTTKDCKAVELYTLKNAVGASAEILTYGGTLQALSMPDRHGNFKDITIGFDELEGHLDRSDYQGQVVGRYANRIANGKFKLGDKTFRLTKNEKNTTCLHGGGEFSHAVWDATPLGVSALELRYTSPAGSHGFPGEVKVKTVYTLTDENELIIDFSAVSDEDTVINLTNHTYFNLAGYDADNILEHVLQISADYFTPTDSTGIPTGELRAVQGTPFDFRVPKTIGLDISADDDQLLNCKGYDHNFCLNTRPKGVSAAAVWEPISGRVMEVYTDLPGVQLYTGNFLDNVPGKGGFLMGQHAGFCLETQYFPDTPNQPSFPQCLFKAGEKFTSRTSFKFSTYRV
ncbi:MAG TPA: aldose epimerase family protein [Clostridia bacterium]|nr:aldose epimerase family protein [Clostridia bacterium]